MSITKPTILLTFSPSRLQRLFPQAALAQLRELGHVKLNPHEEELDLTRLSELAEDADIVIADRVTPGYAELFSRSPGLVAFIRPAMDVRNIDIQAADAAGVLVVNGSPGWVDCVTELILGQMIALIRHIPDSVAEYRAHAQPTIRLGRQLSGSTLGVIGYGNLGRRMTQVGLAMNMSVLVHDPHVASVEPPASAVGLDELLSSSDFVACLAVHTPETENLMNERALKLMKPDAYLINASRGGLVDEQALEQALTQGWIAGAVLDVGRQPDDLPNPRLAALPNVVATPHVGGYVQEAVAHHAFEACSQVAALVTGQKPAEALNWNAGTAARVRSRFESPAG